MHVPVSAAWPSWGPCSGGPGAGTRQSLGSAQAPACPGPGWSGCQGRIMQRCLVALVTASPASLLRCPRRGTMTLACVTEENKRRLNSTDEETLNSPCSATLLFFASSRTARRTGGFQFVFKGSMLRPQWDSLPAVMLPAPWPGLRLGWQGQPWPLHPPSCALCDK